MTLLRDRILQTMLEKQPQIVTGPPGTDGTNGRNGTDGVDGKACLNGVDGVDGKRGLRGLPGADGAPGRDGASFRVGNGPPPMSVPAGDTYLDLDTLDLYVIE